MLLCVMNSRQLAAEVMGPASDSLALREEMGPAFELVQCSNAFTGAVQVLCTGTSALLLDDGYRLTCVQQLVNSTFS